MDIEKRIEELEKRVEKLERAQQPVLPNTLLRITKCPLCGIELTGVMSYSCPRQNCPTGLGPVTC